MVKILENVKMYVEESQSQLMKSINNTQFTWWMLVFIISCYCPFSSLGILEIYIKKGIQYTFFKWDEESFLFAS